MKHVVTRRTLIQTAAAASALVAAPTVLRAQSRELVMIGFGGALDDPYKWVGEKLQQRHRGLTVRVVPGLSAEAIAQIKAARGASPYDCTGMEPPAVLNTIAEGVIEKFDLKQVPNAARIEERFLPDAFGYGAPKQFTVIGIAYNKQMIPNPPQSWADLWKPEYAGKVGLARPQSNLGLACIALAARMATGSDDNLEAGLKKWQELKPTVGRTPPLLTQMMERGEIGLCPLWHTNTAIAASRGLPIGFVKPLPGPMVLPSSGVLFINSAVKEIVLELINEVLDPAHQARASAPPYYVGPTVKGVTPPPEAAAYIPATPAEVAASQTIDWSKVALLRGRTVDAFDRMFAT